MNENSTKNISEKQKATVRRALLLTSTLLVTLSIYSFFNPEFLSTLLNTDQQTTTLMSLVIGLIGVTDFAIGFILFKPKDRI